jgi:hypothetical protein
MVVGIGAAFLIAGGIVYSVKKPDPFPDPSGSMNFSYADDDRRNLFTFSDSGAFLN